MRRITLDANVLAPASIGEGGASARLIGMWREGIFELVLSEHLLRELARTLKDPYFVADCFLMRRRRSSLRSPPTLTSPN